MSYRTKKTGCAALKKMIIYGAGIFGSDLLKIAEARGCKVLFFIDKYKKGKLGNTPILSPDDFRRSETQAPVYMSLIDRNEELKVIGFLKALKDRSEIKNFTEMLLEFPELICTKKKNGFFWLSNGSFDSARFSCENYFSDAKSQGVVKKWMKFRETLGVKHYVEPEGSQYVPKDLNWIKKLQRSSATFLDVGAYTGDSCDFFMGKFRSSKKNISHYFAFEVEPGNFVHLGSTLRKLSTKYPKTRSVALPLGIWSCHGLVQINSSGSATQVFSGAAGDMSSPRIPVAKLDDLFLSMPVDVIKMDIEGSEKEALKGAERIIKEQSPVLLISLYHKPEDLWEIPDMIRKINPNYDMHIRVHAHLFIETVLYCVPKQGGLNVKQSA